MGLSSFDEAGFPGWLGLVLYSVVSELILINYNVTGLMLIHQLVVNSFNKILPTLKLKQLSQPTLEAHSLCYTC